MDKNKKRALKGFCRLKLAPVTENTTSKYEIGVFFDIPNAQSMTQEVNSTNEVIYADDTIYLDNKSWLGLNTTITLADTSLELMSELGFGTYDETTETLKWDPQGKNKEFSATFCSVMAGGSYRMFRMYSFIVSEVKPSGFNTKGEGTGISAYQIVGMFTARKLDNLPGEIHDGDDLTWLDAIE